MTKKNWLLAATPPTPNGDLHVGHLSGPYLGADIFRRARTRLGDDVIYVCFSDDNQNFVVASAENLSISPNDLVKKANNSIQTTFNAYDIVMDSYCSPDAAHRNEISEVITTLIDSGLIISDTSSQLFDCKTGRSLYEAFTSGICEICLEGSNGGVCEACGHPNDAPNLIQQSLSGNKIDIGERRKEKRLIIPIEDYREELIEYYKEMRHKWRPHIFHYLDELLSKPLADFQISFPSNGWGISINSPGWEDHVVNPSAEMGIGLLHQFRRFQSVKQMESSEFAHFFGFDNSYFFVIIHPVLQFALKRAGVTSTKLHDYMFTNEFYNLDNKKFSTSQRHLILGRKLLEDMTSDEARFYLSLHGPELAESNFVLPVALKAIQNELHEPFSRIADRLREINAIHKNTYQIGKTPEFLGPIQHRFDFYCQADHFSPRQLARILKHLLKFISLLEIDTQNSNDVGKYLHALAFLNERLAIFMPRKCQVIGDFLALEKNVDLGALASVFDGNISAKNST